jgi:phosphopantothenoylcysteine decarboxylase/phosphopantothenate--cysteine ligase
VDDQAGKFDLILPFWSAIFMARILITSGPTRQFLDPVRYLTNASSGRMGLELVKAAIDLGHEVVVVSGPVEVKYPVDAQVVSVVTTDEMLAASQELFVNCDGVIGAAAPCDYQPHQIASEKIAKTGAGIVLHLIETPDVLATLGNSKSAQQWAVAFALETTDARFRAITKLEKKACDLVVLNGPSAMNSRRNDVELLDPEGDVVARISGSKRKVARGILKEIQQRLIAPT